MKKRWSKAALFVMILLVWCSVFCAGFAAEVSVSVSIPVSIVLEGTEPSDEEIYQIELIPQQESNPRPEGDQNVLRISGSGTDTFSKVTYSHPGIYHYRLRQLTGTAECEYDDAVYNLVVTVSNSETGLEIAAVVYQDNENEKLSDIVFCNRYPEHPEQAESEGQIESEQNESEQESQSETGTESEENMKTTEKTDTPVTGDDRPFERMLFLWMLSGIAVWILLCFRKRKLL